MVRSLLIALAAVLAAPATAAACAPLPAGFADDVRIGTRHRYGERAEVRRTSVCAIAGGRRVVLRRALLVEPRGGRPRGTLIGGAAAAGRRVAWIETRFASGRRRAGVVRVVRIGARGRVHPERRIAVRLERSTTVPGLDVAITRRGELAWISARFPGRFERIVYDPPHGRPRVVAVDSADRLAVEDGRTLRWSAGEWLGFYELPRPATGACPPRTRFHEVAANDTIQVTQRTYFGTFLVLRACMLATGRDLAISQAHVGFMVEEQLDVTGVDRRWVVVRRIGNERGSNSCEMNQETIDSSTGNLLRETRTDPCHGEPPLATLGAPVAVTARGATAWVAGDRLLYGTPDGVVELDRGAIEGLRARGTAIEWINGGVPRSMELP